MKPKSFAFFGDIFEKLKSDVVLFGNYTFSRANKDEIFYLKQQTDRLQQLTTVAPDFNRFEYSMESTKIKGHFTHTPLSEEDWLYYVVRHDSVQLDRIFPLVVGLSALDLTIIMEGVYSGIKTTSGIEVPGMLHHQLKAVNFFLDNHVIDSKPKFFRNENLDEMRSLYAALVKFESQKDKFTFISKALDDFLKLQEISIRSPFKLLNYFSIFELLLTTYRPGRSQESTLNAQLQNKLALINNRLSDPIDVKKYFKGPDTLTLENIVAKLYEYRNNIAHGNSSDFENDLQIIGGSQSVKIQFLRDLLKQAIIIAVNDPTLISDLKKC